MKTKYIYKGEEILHIDNTKHGISFGKSYKISVNNTL